MSEDYGVNANDPEGLIACVIDNGEQASKIMKVLSDYGFKIVKFVERERAPFQFDDDPMPLDGHND